jgi:hypothetical protein
MVTVLTCGDQICRSVDSPEKKESSKDKSKKRGQTLPTSDAEMYNAGSSFLDAIEKSLGLRYVTGEENRQAKTNLQLLTASCYDL